MPSVKGKKFPYTKKGKAAAKAYKKKTGSKKKPAAQSAQKRGRY
jgi:hypothetical protein|tara:strand:+ start:1233 stop:1364 length:132 start_codon:yes stop_codon:yes gene_type:complete